MLLAIQISVCQFLAIRRILKYCFNKQTTNGQTNSEQGYVKAEQTMMDVKNPRSYFENAQAKKLTAKDPIVSNGAFNQIKTSRTTLGACRRIADQPELFSVLARIPAVEGSELPWKKMKISMLFHLKWFVRSVPRKETFSTLTSGYGMEIYHAVGNIKTWSPSSEVYDKQKELSVGMRAMLVDWFVDVCQNTSWVVLLFSWLSRWWIECFRLWICLVSSSSCWVPLLFSSLREFTEFIRRS
uniref:Uncharacterized protein n=1 Tax=Ditylenchus dipsaci TaxID=166011 RepID=A0A915ETP2_9BILA